MITMIPETYSTTKPIKVDKVLGDYRGLRHQCDDLIDQVNRLFRVLCWGVPVTFCIGFLCGLCVVLFK